jgi:hypothetical protein
MSNYIITTVDSKKNIHSLAKFNRENVKSYQKKLQKTRFRNKVTDEHMYTLWLVVDMDQMHKIKNYCKVKNISMPLCKEEV